MSAAITVEVALYVVYLTMIMRAPYCSLNLSPSHTCSHARRADARLNDLLRLVALLALQCVPERRVCIRRQVLLVASRQITRMLAAQLHRLVCGALGTISSQPCPRTLVARDGRLLLGLPAVRRYRRLDPIPSTEHRSRLITLLSPCFGAAIR